LPHLDKARAPNFQLKRHNLDFILFVMVFILDRQIFGGIVAAILTASFLVGLSLAQNVPASFVFGDSLVDVGNNNYIVSLAKANYVPNGMDFGIPTGRFTNGRTIVDIIGKYLFSITLHKLLAVAILYKQMLIEYSFLLFKIFSPGQELGLKEFTPPYLAPTTSGSVVLKGVNYASGGGGILNHTGKLFVRFLFH
jgi:hypothetical protein